MRFGLVCALSSRPALRKPAFASPHRGGVAWVAVPGPQVPLPHRCQHRLEGRGHQVAAAPLMAEVLDNGGGSGGQRAPAAATAVSGKGIPLATVAVGCGSPYRPKAEKAGGSSIRAAAGGGTSQRLALRSAPTAPERTAWRRVRAAAPTATCLRRCISASATPPLTKRNTAKRHVGCGAGRQLRPAEKTPATSGISHASLARSTARAH